MLIYINTKNVIEIGPDYRRMRLRYEVTNGVSESTEENN